MRTEKQCREFSFLFRITTVGWSKSQLHLTSCLTYQSHIHIMQRVKLPDLTERLV